MAKIIQVLDVNSEGHRVRLDNGWTAVIPHNSREVVIGAEFPSLVIPEAIAPSTEFLNSPAQVQANILSEIVEPHTEEVNEALDRLEALEDGDASG